MLLAGLLTLLFLMIVQLGIALHVRNVLARPPQKARGTAPTPTSPTTRVRRSSVRRGHHHDRARRVVRPGVTATTVDVDGQPVVEVDVKAGLPLVALWGTARTVEVRGHALQEG